MKTVIYGGQIYTEEKVIEKGIVVIDGEKIGEILNVTDFCDKKIIELPDIKNANIKIEAFNRIIAPGSIEMHTNGFIGYNFGNITREGLEEISKAYPKFGVTSVAPTLITDDKDNIKNGLKTIVNFYENYQNNGGNILLPCYLEARYFCNTDKKGAHNSVHLVNSASNNKTLQEIILDEISEFNESSRRFLRVITIDPALAYAEKIIKSLVQTGYKVSIGHSNCTIKEAQIAIDNGASILSHAFNAISMEKDYYGYRIRENKNIKNGLGACLDDNKVFAEIILDNVHSNQHYNSMLIKRKGINYTCLITDACASTKSEKGENLLGGEKVIILSKEGNEAAYREDETLAGSVLTMDQAIKNCVKLGYSLKDAFTMASLNPAKAFGIDNQKGSISSRKYADIAIYEKAIEKKGDGYYESIGKTLCTLVESEIKYVSDDFKGKIK